MTQYAPWFYHNVPTELAQAQAAQHDKTMTQFVSWFYHDVLPELAPAQAAQCAIIYMAHTAS